MKKLMIAAAIVCTAVVSQAAAYQWEASTSLIWSTDDQGGTYPPVAAGTTVYFAFVDAYSQADLVNDYAAGTVDLSKFAEGANNAVNAAGGIGTSAEFSADYTTDQQAYFVLFENGNMFVSDETTAAYLATGTQPVGFADQRDIADWESNVFQDAKVQGWDHAGWYNNGVAPIPEPTSGLLLLLGVAGLALRRRRA